MLGLIALALLFTAGLSLWAGVTGTLPWTRLRVLPVIQGCLLALALSADGGLASLAALMFLSGYVSLTAAIWAGVLAFALGTALQLAVFIAIWGLCLGIARLCRKGISLAEKEVRFIRPR